MASKRKIDRTLQQAVNFHREGDINQAEKFYKKVLTARPSDAEALCNLGMIAYQAKKFDVAVGFLEHALNFQPERILLYIYLGRAYLLMGNTHQAEIIFLKAIKIDPECIDIYCLLSDLYTEHNKLDDALQLLSQALAGRENDRLFSRQAFCFMAVGKFDEAIAGFRRALECNPDDAGSMRMLADLVKHNELDDDILRMVSLLNSHKITDEDRIQLNFGLGKSYEDLKQYKKSFDYYVEGNRLKRKTFTYQSSVFDAFVDRLRDVFGEKLFQQRSDFGRQDKSPIFIVGMPRSGSTLVEQIISSHRDVFSVGESDELRNAVFLSGGLDLGRYPESVVNLDARDIDTMAGLYLKFSRKHTDKPYVTDKMLKNFMHIGIIMLIFPNAKVIHCVRDPVATCLSCFQQLFRTEQSFSFNLVEIGRYYQAYKRLMQHWHEVLPGKIYDIEYERLVCDQQGETIKLLEYCGLEWDESCLNFNESSRSVITASVQQVRQNIYKGSLDRWLPYKDYLKPLLDVLEID